MELSGQALCSLTTAEKRKESLRSLLDHDLCGNTVYILTTAEKRKESLRSLLDRIYIYYPVHISTTVFSYSRAVQYHTILHG